jgi:hypothetical protein
VGGSQPKSKLSLLEDPEDGKDDYGRAADILQGAKKKLPRPELVDRLILSVRQARPSGVWRAPAGHTALFEAALLCRVFEGTYVVPIRMETVVSTPPSYRLWSSVRAQQRVIIGERLPRPGAPRSIRGVVEPCSQAGEWRFAYSVAEEKREGRARQKERLPSQTCTRCVAARPLLNYQYSHYHSANNVNYALPKVDYLRRSPSVTLKLKLILQHRLKRQKRLLRTRPHPCTRR